MQNRTASISRYIYLVPIAVVLLAYSAYRSLVVGITHDEVYTYLIYVPMTIIEIISYDPIFNANNHIFNTLLMKLSCGLFGDSELALRLPNFLGHCWFVYYSLRLAKEYIPKTELAVLAFVLLNCNPYLFDFFSVARGYGLGAGCMLGSIYYFFRQLDDRRPLSMVFCLLWAILAVWSNFINLLYFVALVAIYGLIELDKLIRQPQINWRKVAYRQLPSLIATIILGALIIYPIKQLRTLNEFSYGGDSSFYKDTFERLVGNSLYNERYLSADTIPIFSKLIMVVLGLALLSHLWTYLKRGTLLQSHKGMIAGLFLVILALASIVQHHLLDVAYLQDRRAIIFLPFAALLVVYALQTLSERLPRLCMLLTTLLVLFSANHIIRTTDSYMGIREWYYDEDTKHVLELISKDPAVKKDKVITLSTNWTMKNSVDFYQKSDDLKWLAPMSYKSQDFAKSGADYYYLYASEIKQVSDTTEQVFYKNGRALLKTVQQ